jgi:ABC-type Fe3+ transport system permease subunit
VKRLIPFAVILGIYTYLARWIYERLGYTLDRTSFTVGITVAAFTGLTWFLVSDWWSAITRPYRPQTVKSDTRETPIQIGWAALWAIVKLFCFIAAVIVLIILAVRFS